jgi:hypothetical protein
MLEQLGTNVGRSDTKFARRTAKRDFAPDALRWRFEGLTVVR